MIFIVGEIYFIIVKFNNCLGMVWIVISVIYWKNNNVIVGVEICFYLWFIGLWGVVLKLIENEFLKSRGERKDLFWIIF